MAVAQIQLCRRCLHDLSFRGQIPHHSEDILHFAAIGTRIHIHCTAHRAGDAVGKFQTGQAVFQRSPAQGCEPDARTGCQHIAFNGNIAAQCRNVDHHTGKTLVRKQDIAAVAQQIIADSLLFAQRSRTAKLLFCLRLHEQLCRAADLKGTVCRKRLVLPERDACLQQLLFESFHSGQLLNQSILSSRPRRISSSRAAL